MSRDSQSIDYPIRWWKVHCTKGEVENLLMDKWNLCSIIAFSVAFVLLAVICFSLIVAAYSPVSVDFLPYTFDESINVYDASISVELEPLGIMLLFVISGVLIAVGVVCRAKRSQKSKPGV